MSRVTAVAIVVLDSLLSIATLVQSSLTMAVVVLTVAGSLAISLFSVTLRSLLWPTYFWDDVKPACGAEDARPAQRA